jgi:hypothetical protein
MGLSHSRRALVIAYEFWGGAQSMSSIQMEVSTGRWIFLAVAALIILYAGASVALVMLSP